MAPTTHLVILGDREGLTWVLREQRVAVPVGREREGRAVSLDDVLLLYTTRGCFHNPTRDRGRVIGEALVVEPPAPLDPPVELGGRRFGFGCAIELKSLAPLDAGIELAPLVPELAVFPDAQSWSVWLRRSILPLPAADAGKLRRAVALVALDPSDEVDAYVHRALVRAGRRAWP